MVSDDDSNWMNTSLELYVVRVSILAARYVEGNLMFGCLKRWQEASVE